MSVDGDAAMPCKLNPLTIEPVHGDTVDNAPTLVCTVLLTTGPGPPELTFELMTPGPVE